MDTFLSAARVVQFAVTITLTGVFAFECFLAGPALRRAGGGGAMACVLRRRFWWLACACLVLALASGAAWLVAVGSAMSGEPLGAVIGQGVVGIVLTQTQFGEDWLLRLGFAGLLALCLVALRLVRRTADRVLNGLALLFAALLLVSLAWAGHGASTPGAVGEIHLAGDILHLLGVGFWLGTLPPLALFLAAARRGGETDWRPAARFATRRYSVLAVISVTVLLAGGLINTWFLAGTVPALVGTEYGRLLLAKIALFLVMLVVAAVNLLRLSPRLAAPAGTARASLSRLAGQLRRNALIEAAIGLGILCIVGVLGILPPGLHTEPGWPFPFRVDFAALSAGWKAMLAVVAALFCGCAIGAVASAAAGHYRRMAAFGGGLLLCLAAAWIPLGPALEPAYPTSFYAPAEPYNAPAIAAGAHLYASDCAVCHGAGGQGNGPGAAGLRIRPANLTEPHLFAHSPGDLFWWVSHGKGGVMPGFAKVLTPDQRWDLINFVRARAAGILARGVGPQVTTAVSYPFPDFAFEEGKVQHTLDEELRQGPVLLILFTPPAPAARLAQLAAARPRLAAARLHVVAVGFGGLSQTPAQGGPPPFVVGVSSEASAALALFRAPGDGGETEVMLDRGGMIRARWTASGPARPAEAPSLAAEAEKVARLPVAAPSHAGHVH